MTQSVSDSLSDIWFGTCRTHAEPHQRQQDEVLLAKYTPVLLWRVLLLRTDDNIIDRLPLRAGHAGGTGKAHSMDVGLACANHRQSSILIIDRRALGHAEALAAVCRDQPLRPLRGTSMVGHCGRAAAASSLAPYHANVRAEASCKQAPTQKVVGRQASFIAKSRGQFDHILQ